MSEIDFVSVVIPTFNSKNYLMRTIESLSAQSYLKDKYEIIVVDDGSTDGTRQCFDWLQKEHSSNLKYFYQENKGPSSARNLGVKNARAEIIAFIDSDCIASERWIEEIVKGYGDNKVAGIGGTIVATPSDGKMSQYCAYTKMNEKPKIDKTGIVYLITGNASFRKSCLNLVGGFDERYDFPGGEDPDLCYRIKKKGFFFKYNPNAVVFNSHKHTLWELIITYFHYGKGDAFLTLRKLSNWDLISISGVKWFFYFLKATTKIVLMFINNFKLILWIFKIPFKSLVYYGEGLNMKDSFAYAILDYIKTFSFINGWFFGYIIGKFKGFKISDNYNICSQ